MPQYSKGDENKYFPTTIAALVVVGFALSSIVFAFLKTEPEDVADDIILNPSDLSSFPEHKPNLAPPTAPPVDEIKVCDHDCEPDSEIET
jgi:hypothetical protein